MNTRVPPIAEELADTDLRVSESIDPVAWNAYLAGCGSGWLYHRAEWDRVFAVYDLPVRRLAAERNGRVVGVLPLVWQSSRLFGKQLVSLPWFDSAGVLANDTAAQAALVEGAVKMARTLGAETLEVRQTQPLELSSHVNTEKQLLRLALPAEPNTLWDRFPGKVRNQVRKAEKSKLSVTEGGLELLAEFYDVYTVNMRDLGSPCHHRDFFTSVLATYSAETRIFVVRLENRAVGAGLTMSNGDCLEIPWASSLRKFNSFCVNHLMYWRILEKACRDGFTWFHFGRSSRQSGTYRFKRQWGAEPVPLHWYHLFTDNDTANSYRPQQEAFGWGPRLWRRLPVWLANRLGPKIVSKVS